MPPSIMDNQMEHRQLSSDATPNAAKNQFSNPSRNTTTKSNSTRNKDKHSPAQELVNQVPSRHRQTSAPQLFNESHSSHPPPYHMYTFGHLPFYSSDWTYPPSRLIATANQNQHEWYNQQLPHSFSQPSHIGSPRPSIPSHGHGIKHENTAKATPSNESMEPVVTKQTQTKQQHSGISREILDRANQLNFPKGKFSPQNWKDALTLMYRWKTTIDEDELQQFGSSTASNGRAYSMSKSVNRFCDCVLMSKSKRRMFSDHWNDSGLKKIVEQYHEEDLPPYYSQWLQNRLDEYFSGPKRRAASRLAKKQALKHRQEEINATWKEMIRGVPDLSMEHLNRLQGLIERPYSKTVEVVVNGRKTKHAVKIDGFDGRVAANFGVKRQAKGRKTRRSDETETQGSICGSDDNSVGLRGRDVQHDKENTPFLGNQANI